jgi:hypothetical protein
VVITLLDTVQSSMDRGTDYFWKRDFPGAHGNDHSSFQF